MDLDNRGRSTLEGRGLEGSEARFNARWLAWGYSIQKLQCVALIWACPKCMAQCSIEWALRTSSPERS
jgi:hypothetical protein